MIEIISNGICGLNFKQKYMIVGLLWFHQYYHCLPLVSPAIAISRWFVSKLVFYYLRHENICLRHENVRLEVKMWDLHLKCGIERYGNISYVAQFELLICGVKVLHTCMSMKERYHIALNYSLGVYFFLAIFIQAAKRDRYLLVEDSHAV